MAFVGDQQPNFKHFCRICKKGFMCGRALGGHMRAHGIGDESGNVNDDDPASDWEEKIGRSDRGGSNGRMYALRTNPNRLKSCRVCENCGKEFSSWKSFLGHGKCRSGEVESPVSSPDYEEEEEDEDEDEEEEEEEEEETGRRGCSGWSKRKRTTRAKVEEEDLVLAKCLMQLSSARVDQYAAAAAENDDEESCASAGKVDHEEHQMRNNGQIRFLNPLSIRVPQDKAKGVAKGMFECKACKKVFNSHQALGGHRASHKKVKGCFAAKQEHFDETLINADVDFTTNDHDFFPPKSISSLQFEHGSSSSMAAGTSRRKSKVHECSVCHRIFSSGQALGGHKRCHWITSNSPDTPSLVPKFHHLNEQIFTPPQIKEQQEELDLNFPAPTPTDDNVAGIWRDPKNPLSFEVSTDIHLHPWIEIDEQESKNDKHHHNQQQQQQEHHHHQNKNYNEENNGDNDHRKNKNNGCEIQEVVDDGADSKVKLAKLSELKDMKSSGSSTGWLQVGIGSTTDHHVDEDP